MAHPLLFLQYFLGQSTRVFEHFEIMDTLRSLNEKEPVLQVDQPLSSVSCHLGQHCLSIFSERSSAWNIFSERSSALNIPSERSSALVCLGLHCDTRAYMGTLPCVFAHVCFQVCSFSSSSNVASLSCLLSAMYPAGSSAQRDERNRLQLERAVAESEAAAEKDGLLGMFVATAEALAETGGIDALPEEERN